jgi:hypothetical protein
MYGSATTYSNSILTGSRSDVALETSANPSLLQIFIEYRGEDKPKTPGQTALDNLRKGINK